MAARAPPATHTRRRKMVDTKKLQEAIAKNATLALESAGTCVVLVDGKEHTYKWKNGVAVVQECVGEAETKHTFWLHVATA